MKHILTLGAMALILIGGALKAQDCEYIVSFKYGQNLGNVPPSKIDYWCRYNSNSFFYTNSVPSGASVYSISELVDNRTQMHLPSNYVVNPDSLCYFKYDFSKYQKKTEAVYFLTEGSEYRYLGVKGYETVLRETGEPNCELDVIWFDQRREE